MEDEHLVWWNTSILYSERLRKQLSIPICTLNISSMKLWEMRFFLTGLSRHENDTQKPPTFGFGVGVFFTERFWSTLPLLSKIHTMWRNIFVVLWICSECVLHGLHQGCVFVDSLLLSFVWSFLLPYTKGFTRDLCLQLVRANPKIVSKKSS